MLLVCAYIPDAGISTSGSLDVVEEERVESNEENRRRSKISLYQIRKNNSSE